MLAGGLLVPYVPLAVAVVLGVVLRVAAVPVPVSVDVDGVVAADPSRRCITGGVSGLSELIVLLVSEELALELVVLCVVEVDAGRDGSGQVLDCEPLGELLLEVDVVFG